MSVRGSEPLTLDDRYLARFSADVVPVVSDRLQEPLRSCVLRQVLHSDTPDGWPAWNLSRSAARDVTFGPVTACG